MGPVWSISIHPAGFRLYQHFKRKRSGASAAWRSATLLISLRAVGVCELKAPL